MLTTLVIIPKNNVFGFYAMEKRSAKGFIRGICQKDLKDVCARSGLLPEKMFTSYPRGTEESLLFMTENVDSTLLRLIYEQKLF